MQLVILYSDKKQLNDFTKILFARKTVCETEFFKYKYLNVLTAKSPVNIDAKNSLVVLLDTFENEIFKIEKSCICIINSSNINGLKLLKEQQLNAIICGNSPTDTFNISSIKEDNITVCQQRDIKNIFGINIPPREFVTKRQKDVSIEISLLASAAQTVIDFNKY